MLNSIYFIDNLDKYDIGTTFYKNLRIFLNHIDQFAIG